MYVCMYVCMSSIYLIYAMFEWLCMLVMYVCMYVFSMHESIALDECMKDKHRTIDNMRQLPPQSVSWAPPSSGIPFFSATTADSCKVGDHVMPPGSLHHCHWEGPKS